MKNLPKAMTKISKAMGVGIKVGDKVMIEIKKSDSSGIQNKRIAVSMLIE